jgi:hypothetical protein
MDGFDAIEREIHALAAAQHGVLSRRQLLAIGLGADAIDHPSDTGRLTRLHRGVYALGHAELRREGTMLGVLLAAGRAPWPVTAAPLRSWACGHGPAHSWS